MKKHQKRTPWAGIMSATCILGLFGASLLGACNTNTVEYLTGQGVIVKSNVTNIDGQVPMDILWVVDNSFSMCQEQKVLRDNFSDFIDVIERTNLDFHIALTTTHAPESTVSIEPVALEARLQSTPQPIPGNNQGCLRDDNGTTFGPLRESLDVAKKCLRDPAMASQFEWSDAQISCALDSPMKQGQNGCVAASGVPDRNADMRYDIFDLFPDSSQYRDIPLVLKADDYRTNGVLNSEKLNLDFTCMATVGTRGDGYEKGLRAAVNAVSLDNTGGAAGIETANTAAPNHGFIRENSGFALIFVTDENDCSHNGEMQEIGNTCGADICEFMNSSQVSSGDSVLIDPAEFAEKIKKNLMDTKGKTIEDFNESTTLIASINGTSKRYDKPFPDCGANPEKVQAACSSNLGEAFSGDRYERFMRQFTNFYPRSVLAGVDPEDPEAIAQARNDFSKYEPLGWMCTDTFAPALTAIAEFINQSTASCISEDIQSCEADADCPVNRFTGEGGVCTPLPGSEDKKYCSTGILLKIERNPSVEAVNADINAVDYCLPNSINELETKQDSCVIDPSRYAFDRCASGVGLQFRWSEAPEIVQNKLSGYTLETVFAVTPE